MVTTIQVDESTKEMLEKLKIHKRQPFNEVILELIKAKEGNESKEKEQKPRVNSLEEVKRLAIPVLKEHGIRKAAVFGSFARGDFDDKSDVDFLIEPPDGKFSLLDLAGVKVDLEEVLGRKVDLVLYRSIYEPIKGRILKEQIILYE
ncbi:MAG: nucleotidyltransferase family protein [Candidatus Parvarchaeota archaeon]|nr:nucleotidyltransferase family protein [Candidatus Parvarchaeum tengchongense]MCW1295275.1 nucleotidyltransferase family protein [Candidatus Parvarchaeum tengchongense]MCW1299432.1 nucleotidyltransferase family protein [Candidatus Parvarchaeum tengchongense]MCW1311922.1 nucleotidyltransferase family protein [Candidatus Parvarchaeum tengchongense]